MNKFKQLAATDALKSKAAAAAKLDAADEALRKAVAAQLKPVADAKKVAQLTTYRCCNY